MTDLPEYTPPAVWEWEQGNGGKFANINRPVAGAIEEHAQAQGLAGLVNSLDGLRGVCD